MLAILNESACNGRENYSVLTHKLFFFDMRLRTFFHVHSYTRHCLPFSLKPWLYVRSINDMRATVLVAYKIADLIVWMSAKKEFHFILAFFKTSPSCGEIKNWFSIHNGIKMLPLHLERAVINRLKSLSAIACELCVAMSKPKFGFVNGLLIVGHQ